MLALTSGSFGLASGLAGSLASSRSSAAALGLGGALAGGGPSRTVLYVLAGVGVLLVASGIFLLIWWLRLRSRRGSDGAQQPAQSVPVTRLREIWETFLAALPGAVRTTLPDYAHFVVFGNTGAGKSALISRKVDWQGQASQFMPSYTADPLMQIYLGSRTVAQELSAVLQDSTSRAANEALKRLFRSQDVSQAPTVVVVLMAPALMSAAPDQLRLQAQLLRGKINVLSESCGSPVRVRICLTYMDRVRGYTDFARFLYKNRLPLELDVGAEAGIDLAAGLSAYERYLPRALTTLSLTSFESMIEFLRGADQLLAPLLAFIQALSEGSVASRRPEVQRVYFSTLSADEQVGNPFEPPRVQRGALLGWFLARWLRPLGIRPAHALLGTALVALGLSGLFFLTRRHRTYVDSAAEASAEFAQSVARAQSAHVSGESDVVRRAEQRTRQALLATTSAEDRFRPLRLLYRPDKRENERRYVDGIRSGYLQPSLERAIRQRARDKILMALVALYATRDNTLGAIVKAQSTDWSTELNVPRDTLLDYVSYSATPWTELALVTLPLLPLEETRYPVSDLQPWRAYLGTLTQAVRRPFLTLDELRELQREGERLREALSQIRRGTLLRQLYRNLAEETPLDMIKLFGRELGVLVPNPWLVDHQEPLSRVLAMVRESNIRVEKTGTKSLYQLLLWLNESGGASAAAAPSRSDELTAHFVFPSESHSYDVSSREWAELLARSRKRTLSGYSSGESDASRYASSRGKRRSGASRCGLPTRRHPDRRPCMASAEPLLHATDAAAAGDRKPRNNEASRSLPLWSREEFTPKLAALLTGDELPAAGLSDIYNRVVYQREVLPLVHELKKALGGSRNLSSEEKIALSRMVQEELSTYARRYCASLLDYHLGYYIGGGSSASLHSELVDLIKPGSRFVTRLRTVADNATLTGLEEPYLRPLALCIAEFKPIVELMTPKPKGGAAKDAPKDAAKSDAKPAADGKAVAPAAAPTPPPTPTPGEEGSSSGLAGYNEAVVKLIVDLDRPPASGDGAAGPANRTSALASKLSAIGRAALTIHEGGDDSALRKAEQFLDGAGVSGALRRPFLSPFLAVYHSGATEIEGVLATHFREVILAQLEPLFARYPFNRAAEREVTPAELDALSEKKGPLFAELRSLYAPVLSESGGSFTQRSGALGPLRLPKELLPTIGKVTRLSRALFAPDGNRQPLQLAIRGLPGAQIQSAREVQPALAYLQVGKAAAHGFNQQPSAVPLLVDWWAQGAAVVGVESVSAQSGRKHTQTLEVTDSAWSLFRLLQRSSIDPTGVSTWHINSGSAEESHAIRFAITPDPWELFGVRTP